MNNKQRELLAKRWISIASSNNLKAGTKAYTSAEFYFWQGVLNFLDTSGEELPAFITICLMSGRSVSEEVLKTKPLPKGVFSAQGGSKLSETK